MARYTNLAVHYHPTCWPLQSGHNPDTRLFDLRGGFYLIFLGESDLHFADHAWYSDVHPCDCQVRRGVTSDVPRDKAVAIQPVRELARQAGHLLLPCVRPISSFPSMSSAATQARKHQPN